MFKLRKHTMMGETTVEPKGFSSPAASDQHIERHLSEVEKARQDLLKACQEMMEAQREELATSPPIPTEASTLPAAMETPHQIEPDLSRDELDALLEQTTNEGVEEEEAALEDQELAEEELVEVEPIQTAVAVPKPSLAEQILAAARVQTEPSSSPSPQKRSTVAPPTTIPKNSPQKASQPDMGRGVLAQNSPVLSSPAAWDEIMQAIVTDDIASHRRYLR